MRRVLACLTILILVVVSAPASAEPLRLATSSSGWSIWVADELGYFEEAGVDVEVERVASGVMAGEGLLAGNYDVATMSGFAFVTRSFHHDDLRLLGNIAAIANVRMIARNDRGIIEPKDLEGKNVGLRQGSVSEFFLGRLLDLHNVNASRVALHNILPPDLPEALKSGRMDAIVSWQPYAKLSQNAMDGETVTLTVQGGQSYYFDLVATDRTIEARRDDLIKMLKALHRASQWAAVNTEDAQAILSRRLGISTEDIRDFWGDHVMDMALSQDMLFLMEEEAIWRVEHGYSSGEVPDFLERIDTSLLEEVDPVLVTIIR